MLQRLVLKKVIRPMLSGTCSCNYYNVVIIIIIVVIINTDNN